MTILIHEGKKADNLFLKGGTIPGPSSTENVESKLVQTITKRQVQGGETDKWKKIVNTCIGFSEETFIGVHDLYTMKKTCINHHN